MSDLLRFSTSLEEDLLVSFDRLVAERGYSTRSEALRDLIRDALVQSRVENRYEEADVLGSLTLVYDHHAHDLAEQMAEAQHARHEVVVSVVHVHVSHDDCMEVIVLRGRATEVHALADALLSLKGVKHGKLFVTLPSRTITERAGDVNRLHRHTHPAGAAAAMHQHD